MACATYADLFRPVARSRALLYDVVLLLGGSLLVALAARAVVPLPLSPVPITGQTLAVLLVGATLGSRRGALSLLLYLAGGLAGLPFFTAGRVGLAGLLGPTGGYLVGFVAAAFVVGLLAERGWDRRVVSTVLAMLLGNGVIYLFGLLWLARYVQEWALAMGLYPFIVGDLCKIALATLLLPLGWCVVGRRDRRQLW